MSTLEKLEEEIAELKEEIEGYKKERKAAATEKKKDKLLDAINICRQNLHDFQLERVQQQQQSGKVMYCKHYILSN
jgi:hypothetical protein